MSLPSAKKRKIFDGRYEVISIVGRGPDSVVYHAKHLAGTQQEVALKVLLNNKPKSSITERLRKEALTLVSCRHKYVVRLDDFHSVADLCYLSMEYAPLGDLRKYLSSIGNALSPETGALFLRQTLEGMDFVHATGVLHRDLKPENILVKSDKEIRIADFGLALLPGDEINLVELQNGVGTLAYIPPEMLDGSFYDLRSDLYSIGVCFYEALAGFHPFEQAPLSEQQEARKDQNIKPLHEINPKIPRHVSAVVAKLMSYSAEHRFQSAVEALRALSDLNYIGTSEVSSPDSPAATAPSTSSPRQEDAAYIPANNDIDDDVFTDNYEDFFGSDDPFSEPRGNSDVEEASSRDTKEMSAQQVRDLIGSKQEDLQTDRSTQKAAAAAFVVGSAGSAESTQASFGPTDTHLDQGHSEYSSSHKGSILALLRRMPPFARPFIVGGIAAGVTIGAVLISNLKLPSSTRQEDPSSIESGEKPAETSSEAQSPNSFPRLPAGTYAGSVQGVLPGVTSPLVLIAGPGENALSVIIGIEGWSPSTVATDVEEGEPSSTIVVRSNGVILNMTGTFSGAEITGTFTNAITGESGIWRVRKIS